LLRTAKLAKTYRTDGVPVEAVRGVDIDLGIGEFVAREGTMLHEICAYVSVWAHMNDFAAGLIDTRHLIFYGTLTLLPLYVATRAVDAWRWG